MGSLQFRSVATALVGCSVALAGCSGQSHAPVAAPRVRIQGPSGVSASCTRPQIRSTVAAFVQTWNGADADAFTNLFNGSSVLDMSTPRQRSLPPQVNGGYTVRTGFYSIEPFAQRLWQRGERLKYRKLQLDPTGATLVGLTASFPGHMRQRFLGSSMVVSCSRLPGAASETDIIDHVVFVAADVAH